MGEDHGQRTGGRHPDLAETAVSTLIAAVEDCVGLVSASDLVQVVRKTLYRRAFAMCQGNVHATARKLQVDRRAVYRAIDEHDLRDDESPSEADGVADASGSAYLPRAGDVHGASVGQVHGPGTEHVERRVANSGQAHGPDGELTDGSHRRDAHSLAKSDPG